MRELIRDTVVGRFLHYASSHRLLQWEEEIDPSLLLKYQTPKPAESSTSSINSTTSAGHAEKQDPEKGSDIQLIDFAENDPENPRNWSTAKKFFVTFQICLLTTSIYIGSAIYTSGIEDIMQEFGVGEVVALLGLTLFVLGYALGPMIWAPLSEMPFFGRNPIYIITLLVFILFQLPIIYVKNFATILVFRFLTGFVGSPVLATGGATIADMYAPNKQIYGLAVWGMAAVCGPSLGPVVSSFPASLEGWRWSIYELIWLCSATFIFLCCFLPETSASNIIYRRTVRYRKVTNNPKLKCQPELEAEGMTGNEIVQMTLIRPFTLSFTEPICFFLNLWIALIYALLYCWFESFPLVFINIYHFSPGVSGLAYLGILIGIILVAPVFFWYIYKYQEPLFNENGDIKPEHRLKPSIVGAFCIPICLFWFGWSARSSVHWIMPIIGSAWFSIGGFPIFMATFTYLGDSYPKYVASVFAGNDLMRSAFGAAFPLFAKAMYTTLGIGWASSLLGFLAILFIPIPFVLIKYGEQIRRRSKMARHDL